MLKKLTVPFFMQVAAFVLALVGIIVAAVSNGTENYPIPSANLLFLFGILGLILSACTTLVSFMFGNDHILSFIARALAIAFISVSLCMVITNRVEVAGTFSFDRENIAAIFAFTSAMVAVGFFLVADLILIVSSFFSKKQA